MRSVYLSDFFTFYLLIFKGKQSSLVLLKCFTQQQNAVLSFFTETVTFTTGYKLGIITRWKLLQKCISVKQQNVSHEEDKPEE